MVSRNLDLEQQDRRTSCFGMLEVFGRTGSNANRTMEHPWFKGSPVTEAFLNREETRLVGNWGFWDTVWVKGADYVRRHGCQQRDFARQEMESRYNWALDKEIGL